MNERLLLFCGDIHGELRKLVWMLVVKYKIQQADIVVLGDFGLGFDKSIKKDYSRIKNRLEKNDIMIYTIRGNHDDPSLFESVEYDFPRLKLWKDHQIYELDGRKIYTIGGACSSDIVWRKDWNEKHPDKPVWWENEGTKQIPLTELPGRVDIVISHDAPISFEPTPIRYEEIPAYQYENILENRRYLEKVKNEITTDYWYYGHFHKSFSGSTRGNMLYRGLGIMELCEAPQHKHTNPQEEIPDENG